MTLWKLVFWLAAPLVGVLILVVLVVNLRARRMVLRWAVEPAAELARVQKRVRRAARVVLVAAVGLTVVVLGLALMVTPGPGLPVLLIGIAILGTEFVWARLLIVRLRRALESLGETMGLGGQDEPPRDAGLVRRAVFRLGRALMGAAERVGVVRAVGWLSRVLRLDRLVSLPPPEKYEK